MNVNEFLRLIAGGVVLVSVLLAYFYGPAWLLLTGFVALNLMQSAFTRWCPMMSILRAVGVRD